MSYLRGINAVSSSLQTTVSKGVKKLSESVSNAFGDKVNLSKTVSNLKEKLTQVGSQIEKMKTSANTSLVNIHCSYDYGTLSKIKEYPSLIYKMVTTGLNKAMSTVTTKLFQNIQETGNHAIGFIKELRQVIKTTNLSNPLFSKISSLIDIIKPQMQEESESKVLLVTKKQEALLKQQIKPRSTIPISYKYKSGKETYGTDTATAIPTRNSAVLSLEREKKALLEKKPLIDAQLVILETVEITTTVITNSLKLLGYSGDKIKEITSGKIDDKTIGFIKEQLLKEKASLPEQLAINEKALKWASRLDRGDYIPSGEMRAVFGTEKDLFPTELVNCYKQEMKIPDGTKEGKTIGIVRRFGVICDWRFGLTNLKEMTDALKDESLFLKIRSQLENQLTDKKLTPEQEKAIKDTLELFSSKKALETAIRERTFILKKQALSAVCGHIIDHAGTLEDGKEFAFVHESLLNPSKKKFDKNGFGHNEENEMTDMKEAFDLIAGSEITFTDGITEPFIDSDGSIKMPRPQGTPRGVNSVVARPIFFNTAVQGHKSKDLDSQFRINREAFTTIEGVMKAKLENMTSAQKNTINALFKKCQIMNIERKSSYEAAENITELASLLDLPISLNCFSAKDRTGYVAGRTMVKCLQRNILENKPLKEELGEKKAKALCDDFGSRGFDNTSVAAQIVEVNTDITCLKVSPPILPGMKGAKSFVQRIRSGALAFYQTVGGE